MWALGLRDLINKPLLPPQRQKSLKRSGDNSVSRTVCWMFRWPK